MARIPMAPLRDFAGLLRAAIAQGQNQQPVAARYVTIYVPLGVARNLLDALDRLTTPTPDDRVPK